MSNQNLKFYRGDDFAFSGTATIGGQPANLTAGTLTLTAQYSLYDTSPVFTLSTTTGEIIVTNALAGQFNVTVPSSYTASLPGRVTLLAYDLELLDMNGKRYTLLSGTVTVIPDVT